MADTVYADQQPALPIVNAKLSATVIEAKTAAADYATATTCAAASMALWKTSQLNTNINRLTELQQLFSVGNWYYDAASATYWNSDSA